MTTPAARPSVEGICSSCRFSSKVTAVRNVPGDAKGVNALSPFVSAAWIITERLRFTARVGAALAVDDTGYEVSRIDDSDEIYSTEVLRPYPVKFAYQVGIIIYI